MIYNENQLSQLRDAVKKRLSEKRFAHTLGVEDAAASLAEYILPDRVSELRAAALLHDISKELCDEEQIAIMRASLSDVTESDILSPPIYHSLTAPFIISRDFPLFATDDILSSALNHTVGAPDMSLFDEIIFVSDYIEAGRSYCSCVSVRERLMSCVERSIDKEACISALHDATIASLENTIISLIERGRFLHEKTVSTRNAFLGRRPTPLV